MFQFPEQARRVWATIETIADIRTWFDGLRGLLVLFGVGDKDRALLCRRIGWSNLPFAQKEYTAQFDVQVFMLFSPVFGLFSYGVWGRRTCQMFIDEVGSIHYSIMHGVLSLFLSSIHRRGI